MSNKIQQWENFYITWLTEGSAIMVAIYERLTEHLLEQEIYDIVDFLNFTSVEPHRIHCTVKHSEGEFHRKERGIRRKIQGQKIERKYEYSLSLEQNQSVTSDIFTSGHRLKIDGAIDNVNNALLKRGLKELPWLDYKRTTIKLKLCP